MTFHILCHNSHTNVNDTEDIYNCFLKIHADVHYFTGAISSFNWIVLSIKFCSVGSIGKHKVQQRILMLNSKRKYRHCHNPGHKVEEPEVVCTSRKLRSPALWWVSPLSAG